MNSAAPASDAAGRAGRHLLQYLHSVTPVRWSLEQRPHGTSFPVNDTDGATLAYLCLAPGADVERYRRIGATVAATIALLLAAEADSSFGPALQHTATTASDPFDGRVLAHFQPIVEFASGSVVAVEALARLTTGSAILGPEAFLHSVDTPGTMLALFDKMLDDSLAFLAEQRLVAPHLSAAVKLEFSAIPADGLADRVQRRLATHGIDAESLTIELIERGAFRLDAEVVPALRQLTDLGVQLVVADIERFPTIVEALPGVPVAGAKLGRRVVSRLTDGDAEFEAARRLLARAADWGLEVVADGVETRAQIERLLRLGCRFGQGYLFAVPQPGASLADVIDMPLVAAATVR